MGDNSRGVLNKAFCSSSFMWIHLFAEASYTCDGVLSTLPILVGVAVVNPSSFVCVLNDPFAYGRGMTLTRAGFLSLTMIRVLLICKYVNACSRPTTVNLIKLTKFFTKK